MKRLILPLAASVLIVLSGNTTHGQDMRELQVQAMEAEQALAQQAAAEHEAAMEEARRIREEILSDREALDRSIRDLKARNQGLHKAVDELGARTRELEEMERELSRQLAESDSVARELVGVIRINAKDLCDLVTGDIQAGLTDWSTDFLRDMADESVFPGMPELRMMVDMLFDQISGSGEVTLSRGDIIDRSGREAQADILAVGSFTALYRSGDEAGFLEYSPAGRNFHALSRLPARRMQREIHRYMEGREEAVPVDVSRGAGLRDLTHGLSLWQQIPRGGPLVWPILTILVLAAAIVAERALFLLRRRFDADGLIRRVGSLAARQDWDGCRRACDSLSSRPVARVIQAGLSRCQDPRQAMEDALQEAMLREVPSMERFLSTLGMLAAIAPLLGLLGTVTGMIDTFQVITLHGTGDPRMMSRGISVALVTTMLGLSVAIPIMLAHALLSRAVDNIIGQMEEKAVALVNIVYKGRDPDGRLD